YPYSYILHDALPISANNCTDPRPPSPPPPPPKQSIFMGIGTSMVTLIPCSCLSTARATTDVRSSISRRSQHPLKIKMQHTTSSPLTTLLLTVTAHPPQPSEY